MPRIGVLKHPARVQITEPQVHLTIHPVRTLEFRRGNRSIDQVHGPGIVISAGGRLRQGLNIVKFRILI